MPARTQPPIVRRLVDPLRDFLRAEAAGGIVLLVATVAAIVWANSPLAGGYDALWRHQLRVGAGPAAITLDLRHVVLPAVAARSRAASPAPRCWPAPARARAASWSGSPGPGSRTMPGRAAG